MATTRNRRIAVSEVTRPILRRHAKLKFDDARQQWVILAPERVLILDETAVEILHICDGKRSIAQIVNDLAAKYTAERSTISDDVIAMLRDLADKGFLTETSEEPS